MVFGELSLTTIQLYHKSAMLIFSSGSLLLLKNQCLRELRRWSSMSMILKDLVWHYRCTMWTRYCGTVIGLIAIFECYYNILCFLVYQCFCRVLYGYGTFQKVASLSQHQEHNPKEVRWQVGISILCSLQYVPLIALIMHAFVASRTTKDPSVMLV